jgi:prepilin-type N-terminal cleavage/methylation domain-containing protein
MNIKQINNQAGYSLIELMTVVSVLAIISVVGMNLFFSTLAGNSKEAAMRQVKQEGDYVVTRMENDLRAAKTVSPCTTDMTSVSYTNLDGSTGLFEVNANRLAAGDLNSFITSTGITIKDGRLYVDCQFDSGAKTTSVNVSFTLIVGNQNVNKPVEIYSQEFRTSVVLRNK